MRNQEKGIRKKESGKRKKLSLVSFAFYLLPLTFLNLRIASASEQPVLTVVQSEENSSQWTGIANRLQAAGVNYCAVSLANVKSAADWGDRRVLLLPNVETLSPSQAIALEEWMSKGGRLIATGPVGSLSAPGVRQLLRSLLGGYWGFSLNSSQKLQASKNKNQGWANKNTLFGEVRGGVLVPDDISGQTAANWDSRDNPTAVVATERSTLLGWRWGVDAASSAELDNAWLRAALERHLKKPSSASNTVEGGSPTCSTSVTTAVKAPSPPPVPSIPPTQNRIATTSQPKPIPNFTPGKPGKSDEAIDQLEQAVRLDVVPNSSAPINRNEAIALQQELENLIGRVESAHLAASAITGKAPIVKMPQASFASTRPGAAVISPDQALEQARMVAKNFPQLVAQGQYNQARQQWLTAKANLWRQFPVDRQLAHPEIRAIWLDRGTIVRAGSEQALAQIFDRLAQSGINTIFFETLNASYTIYPSKIAPQQNPLIRGWDPLASGVKLAHQRGMELHAWVWVFAAGNQRHNQVIGVNPDYPGPVLAANPTWAGYDNRGQMIPTGQGKQFFDPANPQVRQYLLNLYEEIVTRYDVDGLQLDYIRYPFQDPNANRTYGYGIAARQQFQQMTGVDPLSISPSQGDLWQKWTAFRTEQVDSFVAQVSQQLRQKRPNLTLSVAVFPLPERERIQKIQQHWEVWARRGDIDLIVPMTYALDTPRFERLAQPWIASTQLGSTLLVPGMRLLNLSTLGAFDQIQLVRDLPAVGYALFAAENLNAELQKVFTSTQGSIGTPKKEPIPHRQPFQTAAVRYRALQQEWNFALSEKPIKMSSTTAADFKEKADVLQQSLDQLASSPSAGKLIAAKGSLVRFQSQFRGLMRQHSLDNPYQVRVWENRLATIDRLLRYGERMQLRR